MASPGREAEFLPFPTAFSSQVAGTTVMMAKQSKAKQNQQKGCDGVHAAPPADFDATL